MNIPELRNKTSKKTDDELMRIYTNMKEDDNCNLEVFFIVVDEVEKRGLN